MDELPREILEIFLFNLKIKDLIICSEVNEKFYILLRCKSIWKQYINYNYNLKEIIKDYIIPFNSITITFNSIIDSDFKKLIILTLTTEEFFKLYYESNHDYILYILGALFLETSKLIKYIEPYEGTRVNFISSYSKIIRYIHCDGCEMYGDKLLIRLDENNTYKVQSLKKNFLINDISTFDKDTLIRDIKINNLPLLDYIDTVTYYL